MSDTPISEKEIEFAMAMFAANNPNRTGHLCKAMRTLERELNEARQALSGRTISCEACNQTAKERDELKQELIEWRDDRQKVNAELADNLAQVEKERDEWKKRFEYSSIECSFALDSRDKWKACAEGLAHVVSASYFINAGCECNACKAITTFNQLKEKLK